MFKMCSTSILIVFLITVNSVSSDIISSGRDTNCPARNQFKCMKTGRCIAINWMCDGESDCGYGDQSDEQNCTVKTCLSGEFRCDSGQCILKKWKCDGERDCDDGTDEDELKCNAISPPKMQSILNRRGLDVGSKHLQHVSSMSPSPLPVTKFVTTQPSTIKQPTLEAPTPSQLIIDSVGNHGVITNQHFGPTPGGGVAVWFSKPSPTPIVGSGSLSQYHQSNHLSNPVIQSSGDFSVNGMAAPSDMNAIPVTSPDHAVSLFATFNPIGFNDILNPVTHIPNIMTTVSSLLPHNYVTDPTLQFMAAMTTPTSQISNLGWNIV